MEGSLDVTYSSTTENNQIEWKALARLFGATVHVEGGFESKDIAKSNTLMEVDGLIEGVFRMVCFKNKFNKLKKQIESKKPANKQNLSITKATNSQEKRKVENKQTTTLKPRKRTKQVTTPPVFGDSKRETKNNILYSISNVVKDPGAYIEAYCKKKVVAFPEYLFEKSNGVYLCRATFLNERFESRYAYEMETAKQEVSNLIVSYIKHTSLLVNDNELEEMFNECETVNKETVDVAKKKLKGFKEPVKKVKQEDPVPCDSSYQTEIEEIVNSLSFIHENCLN